MARTRAYLIPARDLSKIVNKAIAEADIRLPDIVEGRPRVVRRWDLIGMVVRDLNVGQKFADQVVEKLGPGATTAVLKVDGRILAGFIERVKVPMAGF